MEDIPSLLHQARVLISLGKPSDALKKIIEALQQTHDESQIFQILREAKENFELEALSDTIEKMNISKLGFSSFKEIEIESSFVAQQGKKQILKDAYADGSTSICRRCGGLIANTRREAHQNYWCSKLEE